MALVTCPDCSREVSTSATACPRCGCPLQPETTPAHASGGIPLTGGRLWIALGVGCVVVAFAILLALVREPSRTSDTMPVSAPAAAVPAATHEPTQAELVLSMSNAGTALAATISMMRDTVDATSPGSDLFLLWSMKHMTWVDVGVAKDETSVALVLKDPDAERGKAMCASGSIAQISARHDDAGTYYEGQIGTLGSYVHFRAVGSSGKLVEGSPARFCGIVTGRYSFTNAANGTTHTVELVGMFDLPENRATVPKPPAKSTPPRKAPAKAPTRPAATSPTIKRDAPF